MTQKTWNRNRSLFLFETLPVFKGTLLWLSLLSLVLIVLPVRFILLGEFSFNGQLIDQESRVNYVLAVGYSLIVFLATLFTISLCLDRTGNQYLRNNDLLILARDLGRPAFYFVKIASVIFPSTIYSILALTLFWEELYRIAGVNLFQIYLLILPLSLSMLCLTCLFFLMRIFLGNFLIFFIWMLLLPVIYFGNLWQYYGGALRGITPKFPILALLPQFGGIHAYSLGLVGDTFLRTDTWLALVSGIVWTVLALLAGILSFRHQRF